MRIRPRLLSLALVLGTAHALGAQEHRLQVTPLMSMIEPGAIYDHTTTYPDLGGSVVERLKVDGAAAFGGRISYRVTPNWTLGAEATHASSSYFYRYDSGVMQEERHGNGSVTTMQASAARALVRTAGGTRLEASLVGGVHQLVVEKGPACGPPNLGSVCPFPPEPWQDSYAVPFAGAGLGANQRVTSRLTADARVAYSLGRANTTAFWDDLIPQYDAYEAPRHHWLRTVSLSLGLAFGL